MDYNKSSAPPMGWNTGYSSDQPPAPPYQDQRYPYGGPSQPAPAYSAQQQGFGVAPQYSGVGYQQQPYSVGQQYAGQQRIVTTQPSMFGSPASPQTPVNDYLGYSIFTMLCCCLPLGIAALIHSFSTREAVQSGDQVAAQRYSSTARTLNNIALGIGITAFTSAIIYIIVIFAIY